MGTRSFSVGKPTLQTALLKYEAFPDYTRESLILLAGASAARIVGIGVLLGLIVSGTVTAAPKAGNTGVGVLTLANPAIAAGVVPGIYQVLCVEPAADGGTFEVFDPAGVAVGTAKVGVAFAGPVKFTIADGATDFLAGDGFAITVPVGNKAVAWDPAATDGSGTVAGIAIQPGYAADGADGSVLALARGPAIIVTDAIDWPDAATDPQKAAALAALAAKGIIARAS
jgi:hypothetical protein